MRGASPRGDDPRGAYRVLGDQVRAQVIESSTAADLCGAIATSAGQSVGHTDASDVADYASTVLGQVAANVTIEDQKSALATAAALLVAAAESGFAAVAAETGATAVFSVNDAAAADAYTAAAVAYGHTVGATTAAEAMSATAQALAFYADNTVATDWSAARGSGDTTGPLRGAINIIAALRGGTWLTPSPGPKGGRPH